MKKQRRLKAILVLPIATALFAIGWILSNVASKRSHPKNKIPAKTQKTIDADIKFQVAIDEEEQEILA